MRKMSLGIDPNTQKEIIADYYQKTAYSTWVLATGVSSYTYFNNIEAPVNRNYTKGQNFFEQNQGRILAYQMELLDSSGANPTYTPAIATAWGSLRNNLQIVTTQDSTVSDLCLASDISERPPAIVGATPGVGIANFDGGSALVKASSKRAKYFEPPLFVANGRAIDIVASLNLAGGIPSALNGFLLRLYAILEEMPQTNVNAVRQ